MNKKLYKLKGRNFKKPIHIIVPSVAYARKIVKVDNILVDSLINIATNKILAVFGRLEPKDYIDLFAICTKTELSFDEMFALAKQKDTGLSEFYFANTIADVSKFETLPKMKKLFDKEEFVKFYEKLSRKILLRIKPKG